MRRLLFLDTIPIWKLSRAIGCRRSRLRDYRAPAYLMGAHHGSQQTVFSASNRSHGFILCDECRCSYGTACRSVGYRSAHQGISGQLWCHGCKDMDGPLATGWTMAAWKGKSGNRCARMTTPLDTTSARPRRLNFRPARRSRPYPPEQAKRQGEVANLAFLHLGGRERAMSFLNNYDANLEGRPLDIAIASVEGCWRVRRAILRLAASRSSD